MVNTTKKVDALGFDRNQIAAIRRAYLSNKTIYKKMDAISEKIKTLVAQYDALEEQSKAWDAPARKISLEVLGKEMTSREILAAHENPEAYLASRDAETCEPQPAEEAPTPDEEPVF